MLSERRHRGRRPFDLSPVPGTGVADLNRRQFEDEYLPSFAGREALRTNDQNLEEWLAAAGMIASTFDQRSTILGLLVLGASPRDFIPGAYVQFLRINGHDLADPIIDERVIDGPIPDMLRNLDDKLRSHNHRQIDIPERDVERRGEVYPIAALQELTRNAIAHRAYDMTNAPVRVTWFGDRLEIQNPGGPFGSITADNFAQPGLTNYRNPNVAEALKVLGYVQNSATGIPTARHLLKEAGNPDIEFGVEQTHLRATVKPAPVPGKAV